MVIKTNKCYEGQKELHWKDERALTDVDVGGSTNQASRDQRVPAAKPLWQEMPDEVQKGYEQKGDTSTSLTEIAYLERDIDELCRNSGISSVDF